MRKILAVVPCAIALCAVAFGQGILEPHTYMKHGVIERHPGSATVRADFARPLQQAVTAVREEYGWAVNYEDPPYRGKDVADMTNPKYRAAHPNAPPVLGPSGGAFQSTYPETPNMWSSPTAELDVLERIVSDYNESGNPGDFAVRELSDGTCDVIGISTHSDSGANISTIPILDTSIFIQSAARSYGGSIGIVLSAVSLKTGIKIGWGLAPTNLLLRGRVTIGGRATTARYLLMQAVDAMPGRWIWYLLYNPELKQYFFNLVYATRTVYGPFGQRRLLPIGPATLPSG